MIAPGTTFKKSLLPLLFLLLTATGVPLVAQAFSSASKASLTLEQGYSRITDQTRIPLRARIQIKEHWHIQASDVSKENLIPTRLSVASPGSASVVRQIYPDPKPINLDAFGEVGVFEGTVDVAVLVAVPEDTLPAPGESLTLKLNLRIQACDDSSCVAPGTLTKSVTVQRGSGDAEQTSVFGWLRDRLGPDMQSIDEPGKREGKESEQPETSSRTPPDASYKKKSPEEVVKELGLRIDEKKEGRFARMLGDSVFSYVWAMLLVFGWGMMASLSPCVYPMIPLTLSYFGMQAGDDESDGEERRFRVVGLALVYVLGIALTFSVLGVVVALIGVELGFALGNPWFVGFLIVLLVGMGLSLMGLFEIPVPSGLQRMAGNKPGVMGAFSMGAFLGVIAAPCVGPFAAAILAFIAGAGNIFIGFTAMFSFGVGLGILFLVLAIFGESFSAMSAGGKGLKHVKTFWGFVLIGVSLYFVDLMFGLMNQPSLQNWGTYFLAGLLAIWFGVWLVRICSRDLPEKGRPYANAVRLFGLLTIGVGVFLSAEQFARSGVVFPVPEFLAAQEAKGGTIHWKHDFVNGVKRAKKQSKPVLIDFYADWCIPCKQMDRTVLSDPEVAGFINEHYVPIKLDVTDGASWDSKLKMNVFGTHSMPYYAFITPDGQHLRDLSIKGKASRDIFLQHLRLVRENVASSSF